MFNSIFYRTMEWIMRFAYIQLLWVSFTLFGLVAFGLFPATIAAFSVIRKWLMGETDIPITRSFFGYFKSEFLKSNLLGLFITFGFVLIVFNMLFIDVTAMSSMSFIHILLFVVILLYLVFLFYLFPAFVHFQGNVFQVVKIAFLFMMVSPLHTLMMLVSLAAAGTIIYLLPALGFIFGFTVYSFITTWLAMRAFLRVNQKMAND